MVGKNKYMDKSPPRNTNQSKAAPSSTQSTPVKSPETKRARTQPASQEAADSQQDALMEKPTLKLGEVSQEELVVGVEEGLVNNRCVETSFN